MVANSLRDLKRSQHEAARRVQNHVERHVVVRHLDGAQNVLRVIDVDIAGQWKTEKPHRLLSVHQQNDPGIPASLQLRDLSRPHEVHHLLTQDGLQRGKYEEKPEKIRDMHVLLLLQQSFAGVPLDRTHKPPHRRSMADSVAWLGRTAGRTASQPGSRRCAPNRLSRRLRTS